LDSMADAVIRSAIGISLLEVTRQLSLNNG